MLFHTKPSYDHFWVFGCLCYANNKVKPKTNFDAKSKHCIFVGYPFGQCDYHLYDLDSRNIFTSRDAIFSEDQFPFENDSSIAHSPSSIFPIN